MEIRPLHWLIALSVAGVLHAALVMALTTRPATPPLAVPITIDLGSPGGGGGQAAPLAEVAPATGTDAAIDDAPVRDSIAPVQAPEVEPPQPVPLVEDVETVKARELQPPEPAVARVPPKPKPQVKPKPKPVVQRAEPTTRSSDAAQERATVPTRSQASASSRGDGSAGSGGSGPGKGRGAGGNSGSASVGNYYGTLAAWLNRHKRYPSHARRRRQEGTVKVVFTIDRKGHLVSHRILESSGFPLLDKEVQSMLKRAAPMPSMPAELNQAQLTITVPINFTLR